MIVFISLLSSLHAIKIQYGWNLFKPGFNIYFYHHPNFSASSFFPHIFTMPIHFKLDEENYLIWKHVLVTLLSLNLTKSWIQPLFVRGSPLKLMHQPPLSLLRFFYSINKIKSLLCDFLHLCPCLFSPRWLDLSSSHQI